MQDLELWLTRESQYVRLRAAVTGDSIKQTIDKVAPALYGEACIRFPGVDAIGLLAKRARADRKLASLSYDQLREMRAALRLSRQIPDLEALLQYLSPSDVEVSLHEKTDPNVYPS